MTLQENKFNPGCRICLGYTSYRLETLPFVREKMQSYQCIVLEEPPTPGFQEMLRGEMAVQDYLMLTEFGFPGFAHSQCKLLQEMHARGKEILQVEPFVEELIGIHEFFAAGGTPEQIRAGTRARLVYEAERDWSARLMDFYKVSGSRQSFSSLVQAVKDFAGADAEKGRLRDSMRARALEIILPAYESVYLEAGYIHFFLAGEVYMRKPARSAMETFYSMQKFFRTRLGKRQLLGPGDVLTLLYTWMPDYVGHRADLLAARSLIYNKIVHKEEMLEEVDKYPHSLDELKAVQLAGSLDYEQCRELYQNIRGLSTQEARDTARRKTIKARQ
ncbi:hypothetical protein [Desulfonatronospira sp.]|uniref:hypothetical protein n=1 Tax=Desulfonatronospira sp. TaxID=1962951 RepID=UPI0025C14A69|nr:hypothetical protein [Desulfonatronospira sp.]